jgi:hypothetical protein
MNLQVSVSPYEAYQRSLLTAGQLANTEEFEDGKSNGALGEVFIRYVHFEYYVPVSERVACLGVTTFYT